MFSLFRLIVVACVVVHACYMCFSGADSSDPVCVLEQEFLPHGWCWTARSRRWSGRQFFLCVPRPRLHDETAGLLRGTGETQTH